MYFFDVIYHTMHMCMLTFLTVVGVSFDQSSYRVNEASCQVQIVLVLTSPLPNDTIITVTHQDYSATSE